MGHLFLDIETYVSTESNDSGINPYLPESKVILIAYNYYESEKPPIKTEIKQPIFLKEWESDEKNILSDFLAALRVIRKKDPDFKIHGFNILKFDLPYLFGRMKFHNLADNKELHSALFGNVGCDMMHLGSLISNNERNKEQLWGVTQNDANAFFGIQVKEGAVIECSRFYDAGEFDKIEQFCRAEFTFEQLMNSFYLYVHSLMKGAHN